MTFDNTPHEEELRRRFSRMDDREKEIAAELIDSDTLRNVLLNRGELMENIPEEKQREIVEQLPDELLFERIYKEHFMFKDAISRYKEVPRKAYREYKDFVVEMRKG